MYFNQQPVIKDVPLPLAYDQDFSPCLVLRAGQGVSALQIDDFHVNLVQGGDAVSGKFFSTALPSSEEDEASYSSTPLLLDDFESYKQEENIANGGWSASFVPSDRGLQAGSGLSGKREMKASLAIDSQAPISGMLSGKANIPANTSFTLTKPISWPERVPFAVSAKPFAIVRATNAIENNENDFSFFHAEDTLSQKIREEIKVGSSNSANHDGLSNKTSGTSAPAMATLYGTTYYIHSFDGKLLAEYDATGACQKDYIYMGNKLLAEYQPVTATKYYYASDQINSTRIITNSSGAVVYSALFDPYGGMQKQWVNAYSPSLKFSGKERESKSEMDYFGARYYDHQRYRFISVDPVINKGEALANPQLWNLYAYCRNNPITYLDPDGRWSGPTHDEIIDKAFSEGNNKLPDHIRRIFKEASALVDQDQLPERSFMHAMRGPNEDASTAENRMNEYVSLKINEFKTKLANKDKYGAYLALGEAMHPLMDSTAPAHEGFQVWRGMKFTKLPASGVHGTRDAFSKLTPARLTTSVDNIRRIYNEATH